MTASVAALSSSQRGTLVTPQGDARIPPRGRCGEAVGRPSVAGMTPTQPHIPSCPSCRPHLPPPRARRPRLGRAARGHPCDRPALRRRLRRRVRDARAASRKRPATSSRRTSRRAPGRASTSSGKRRDAREAQPRIDRFVAAGESRRGRRGRFPAALLRATARSACCGSSSTARPSSSTPQSGKKLIDLAEETSGDGLRIELGGNLISSAEEGAPPELIGLLAAAVVLLIAFGSVVAAGLPLLVAIFGLGISATLIGIVALVDRHARLRPGSRRPDRDRRRNRLRVARPDALPHRADRRGRRSRRDRGGGHDRRPQRDRRGRHRRRLDSRVSRSRASPSCTASRSRRASPWRRRRSRRSRSCPRRSRSRAAASTACTSPASAAR